MPIATETWIFQMYGSDAGQPVPSLCTKGLLPLCDNYAKNTILSRDFATFHVTEYFSYPPISIVDGLSSSHAQMRIHQRKGGAKTKML